MTKPTPTGLGPALSICVYAYRARHRQHVEQCTEALERYQAVHMELEIAAEELRAAAKSLGRVTGIIDTEDLLDAIFSEFCIGK